MMGMQSPRMRLDRTHASRRTHRCSATAHSLTPSPHPSASAPPQQHPAGARKAATSLEIRVATPLDYWTCADVACRTFYESPQPHNSTSGFRSPADALAEALPGWIKEAVAKAKHVSLRVDTVQCFQMNDTIQEAGHGRTAVLIACSSAASPATSVADSTSQAPSPSPGAAMPQAPVNALGGPLLTQIATALVNPASRPGVGIAAEGRNMLAVANLDNFGDRVPARTLRADRDNAMGWAKRTGIAYVCNVAVLPEARRQGVARALMDSCEALAKEWGCRSVGLHCNPKNTAAMQLYLGMGYRVTPALEDPWIPWLMGRGPDRCAFLIKRLKGGAASTPESSNPA